MSTWGSQARAPGTLAQGEPGGSVPRAGLARKTPGQRQLSPGEKAAEARWVSVGTFYLLLLSA